MLAHTRKHPIEKAGIFFISEAGNVISLPKSMANSVFKHEVRDTNIVKEIKTKIKRTLAVEPNEVYANINSKYGKVAALVKAIRLREGMNQNQFAAAIRMTQGDLSKVEHGKRAIGKSIAKRISKKFGVNTDTLLQV